MLPKGAQALLLGDHPHSVHDAGDIAEQRQQDIDPKLGTNPNLEKNTQRRQENCANNSNKVHFLNPSEILRLFSLKSHVLAALASFR